MSYHAWFGCINGCPGQYSLLEVISDRAASGQTGAVWQRAVLAILERAVDRRGALTEMLGRYLLHADTGQPVHTWPVGG